MSQALRSRNILDLLEANAEAIRAFGVRSLGLFGSRARDAAGQDSDIALVVDVERKSFDGFMDLEAFLEALLGCRVDLVLKETVKPRVRAAIIDEALHAPGL